MANQIPSEEIQKTLEMGKSVFVLLPQNPSFDAAAAALALFLSLRETGKNAFIGSPMEVRVEMRGLVGIDRIAKKIGNRNLIVSFDYAEDSIEKVSYNIEEGKFNLVIEPKDGFPPLDTNKVDFSYEGLVADLMFVVGTNRLEDLGSLYEKERPAFTQATVVNIAKGPTNTNFGNINIVDRNLPSLSELVYQLIKKLKLPVNVDIAGNLLKGIEAQTQNLQSPFVGPETFEAVAQLMRAGGKRSPTAPAPLRQWPGTGAPLPGFPPPGASPFPLPQTRGAAIPPLPSQELVEPTLDMEEPTKLTESPLPPPPPSQIKGSEDGRSLGFTPVGAPIQTTGQVGPARSDRKQTGSRPAPEEWLRPKIFQGGSKLE